MGNLIAIVEYKNIEEPKRKTAKEWGIEKGKELRHNMTPAEKILDQDMRDMKFKHRRQHTIVITKNHEKYVYIVDFKGKNEYFWHIIEVDGGYHNTPEQMEKDAIRTKHLEARGYIVHRITNEEVFAGKGKQLIKEIIDSESHD